LPEDGDGAEDCDDDRDGADRVCPDAGRDGADDDRDGLDCWLDRDGADDDLDGAERDGAARSCPAAGRDGIDCWLDRDGADDDLDGADRDGAERACPAAGRDVLDCWRTSPEDEEAADRLELPGCCRVRADDREPSDAGDEADSRAVDDPDCCLADGRDWLADVRDADEDCCRVLRVTCVAESDEDRRVCRVESALRSAEGDRLSAEAARDDAAVLRESESESRPEAPAVLLVVSADRLRAWLRSSLAIRVESPWICRFSRRWEAHSRCWDRGCASRLRAWRISPDREPSAERVVEALPCWRTNRS